MTSKTRKTTLLRLTFLFSFAPLLVGVLTTFLFQYKIIAEEIFHTRKEAMDYSSVLADTLNNAHDQPDQTKSAIELFEKVNHGMSKINIYRANNTTNFPLPLNLDIKQVLKTNLPRTDEANHITYVIQPLYSRNGHANAALVYGLPVLSLISGMRQAIFQSQENLFASLLFSLFAGSLIVRGITRYSSSNILIRSTENIVRQATGNFSGLFLGASLIGFLFVSRIVTKAFEESREIKISINKEDESLGKISALVNTALVSHQHINAPQILQEAQKLELAPFIEELKKPNSLNQDGVLGAIQKVRLKIAQDREAYDAQARAFEYDINNILIYATLISFFTMVLWQSTARTQRNLETAVKTSILSAAEYKLLAESLPIGLFLYKSGQIQTSNKSWNSLLKRNTVLPMETSWWLVVHPDDQADLLRRLDFAEASGISDEIHYRTVHDDGSISHLSTNVTPVYDETGHLSHLLGFTLDETARVIAEHQTTEKQRKFAESNEKLRFAMRNLEDTMESILHSLVRAVEAKDPYIAGHSERVMMYSVRLGETLELPVSDLKILEVGALVHDIGKIGIPDQILLKPGKLTREEFDIIKRHPEIGANMLCHLTEFSNCLPIVRYHHERFDGNGYPMGLKGNEIPLLVQITGLADTFDALTSARAYRAELSVERALQIMHEEAKAGKFDLHLYEIFADMVSGEGVLWSGEFNNTEITFDENNLLDLIPESARIA